MCVTGTGSQTCAVSVAVTRITARGRHRCRLQGQPLRLLDWTLGVTVNAMGGDGYLFLLPFGQFLEIRSREGDLVEPLFNYLEWGVGDGWRGTGHRGTLRALLQRGVLQEGCRGEVALCREGHVLRVLLSGCLEVGPARSRAGLDTLHPLVGSVQQGQWSGPWEGGQTSDL